MINASETDSYLQLQIAREGHPSLEGDREIVTQEDVRENFARFRIF